MYRLALVGLGPHAQRIYYPYLEELIRKDPNFSFQLLIDLDINKTKIESFLQKQNIKPKYKIYLNSDGQICPQSISPVAANAIKKHRINRMILSTEPKAHKVYLKECVKNKIPVVVDKPVTAPIFTDANGKNQKIQQAKKIYNDIVELKNEVDIHPGARILVECQRRNHGGYVLVNKTAEDIVHSFGVPITFIQIHHSDGMWNMPDEFESRENHPYKYGYGKLMHSGYHFIDLLANLIQINEHTLRSTPDTLSLYTQAVWPTDQHHVLSNEVYRKFFGVDKANKFEESKRNMIPHTYGEVDSFSQIQFTRENKIITTAQLSLMQSGFSRRAWADLPEDTYKGNGRVRHEYVNIHIGALAAIQVHSYQAWEISEQDGHPHEPGDKNHFDIYIYRNSSLIGGKPFEMIRYGGYETVQHRNDKNYLGHNEAARYKTLDELMYDLPSNSEISTHLATNKLISILYTNQIKQQYGDTPLSMCLYKDLKVAG